jgi:cytochrome c oxidase assembly protein Cox11
MPIESDSESRPLIPPLANAETRGANRPLIVAFCLTLVVLLEIGATLASIPMYQIREDIICRTLHGPQSAANVNDSPCKDEEVQGELAFIVG